LGHRFQDLGAIGFDPSLVKAEIAFRKPTHFDDVVDVDVTCRHVGRSSFALRYAMSCSATPVCDVDITYVNIARDTETSAPLPDPIADALRAHADEV
ncbi:thioesterase family protein, partial [Gordonia sp. (in: high G+C Gram-positive bacteria)]